MVRTLEHVARESGWTVVMPDFRETYRPRVLDEYEELQTANGTVTQPKADPKGSEAGRRERVRIVLDVLASLPEGPLTVVMAGHSQGGAAAALACTPRMVTAMDIKGLFMLSSESPVVRDGMAWTPTVPHIRLVHSVGDALIKIQEMEPTAAAWGVPLVRLESACSAGAHDCEGDDINHDCLAKDLIHAACDEFQTLLSAVLQEDGAAAPAVGPADEIAHSLLLPTAEPDNPREMLGCA